MLDEGYAVGKPLRNSMLTSAELRQRQIDECDAMRSLFPDEFEVISVEIEADLQSGLASGLQRPLPARLASVELCCRVALVRCRLGLFSWTYYEFHFNLLCADAGNSA